MIEKKPQWQAIFTICITLILIMGGCTNQKSQNIALPSPAPTSQSAKMQVANSPTISNVQIYKDSNGQVWVPLEETAKSMDMNLHYINDSYNIGETDAIYSVKADQTAAAEGDKIKELPQAPKHFDKKIYMTTQALSTLIGTQVNWNDQNSHVVITPIDDSSLTAQQNASGQIQSLGVRTTNKGEIINYARQFLGTPYQFSARPYESTHMFDCSSFVKYVYSHFGVSLPRSSRSQSQVGQSVDINQLQPGDLMFFYTPGRYASNRIVGHVGMYAGNGQIIHTYGRPGVTITDLNNYWRNRLLFAKRVS
ncbi:C40 family peptidase [Paenibacillus sp. N3.4]|uniref:C40 family peptidase n=1 Tax=Paenibacillus sp. N3.4 TaxID=2603222 RepID=UPI0011CACAE3|nr:C40 family peptidase [Paenibacillus sp. N3.4]TXK70643.1 hypothetical protein FU659_33425 [Paenibacillus sp. N3.4]